MRFNHNAGYREHLAKAARLALAIASVVAAAACAPDAMNSREATGFNAYIQKIGQVCHPLQIGDQDITRYILEQATGENNYIYFLDNTSRLYYNRITPQSYRQALVGFFGAGTYNDQSFNCIFLNLPPNRPNAPGGTN